MSALKLSMIVALDRNRGIGQGNAMPWHLPDDFKHFKALTLGKPILMGRKTAESIGRVLPGRTNLVLTRSGQVPFEGMRAVASLDEAKAIAEGEGASELIHIGQAVLTFGGAVDYFINTVFNYPTLAECYKVAAFDGINRLGIAQEMPIEFPLAAVANDL